MAENTSSELRNFGRKRAQGHGRFLLRTEEFWKEVGTRTTWVPPQF
jgi:hypothetical protein